MRRILFWIQKNIKRNRQCNGFCPFCEHYRICHRDNSTLKAR